MMNKHVAFSNLGLGLFVHYGIYSLLGKGEWVKFADDISDESYERLANIFNPKIAFTDRICSFAKKNGFKYIVFTARHHDGFSLYDTKGLNTYDTRNYIGRDLVYEFITSCKKYGIKPFLYHTLIDWKMEKRFNTFTQYLEYLRKSIDIICSNYGELGGIWLDGQWQYKDRDWELDKLYKIINAKQPNAIITNNGGLVSTMFPESNYVDVVTFEKSNISNYLYDNTIDYYGVEMCQTLNDHWGYTENDINYKSVQDIINDFCICRKYGGNYLLNIGPLPDGRIRLIDKEIINLFGKWIRMNKSALYLPKPYNIKLPSNCFALKDNKSIYIFVMNVPMAYNNKFYKTSIDLGKINFKKIVLLDNTDKINLINKKLIIESYPYGNSLVVKIIKIIIKK